jgi:hypothetical protein
MASRQVGRGRGPEWVAAAACVVSSLAATGLAANTGTATGLPSPAFERGHGVIQVQGRTRQPTPCGPPPLAPCKPLQEKAAPDLPERSPTVCGPSPLPPCQQGISAPKPGENAPQRVTPCGPGGGLAPCNPPQ